MAVTAGEEPRYRWGWHVAGAPRLLGCVRDASAMRGSGAFGESLMVGAAARCGTAGGSGRRGRRGVNAHPSPARVGGTA